MTKLPVGSIMAFAGDAMDTAINQSLASAGWLPCLGQSLSKVTYPDLFSVIGVTYGGDADNLALPDLRGRFVRGAGIRSSGMSFDVGATLSSLTAQPQSVPFALDSDGAHTHGVPYVPGWSNSSTNAPGATNAAWNDGNGLTSANGAHSHTISGGGDAESRPVNVYVDYIIKVLDVSGGKGG